jgi:hypothetical protein
MMKMVAKHGTSTHVNVPPPLIVMLDMFVMVKLVRVQNVPMFHAMDGANVVVIAIKARQAKKARGTIAIATVVARVPRARRTN